MSTNMIAPHNVQIAPFELVHMLSLSVEKKINEHNEGRTTAYTYDAEQVRMKVYFL